MSKNKKEEVIMNKFELPTFIGYEKGTDEYKAVAVKRNAVKREAIILLVGTILKNVDAFVKDFGADIVDAANALKPNVGGGLSRGNTKFPAVCAIFSAIGDTKNEDEIFMEMKLGRSEMRGYMRDMIKKAETPELRKYVSFSPVDGIYKLEAIGENAPDGWLGYVPVKSVEDIEKEVTEGDEDLELELGVSEE